MLQQKEAKDYVLATGKSHSVRDFAELAFAEIGIKLRWEGKDVNEKGIDIATDKIMVEVDPRYFRPTEVELLIGDPSRAYKDLGWKYKYTLEELVSEMVEADIILFKKDRYLKEGGHQTFDYFE